MTSSLAFTFSLAPPRNGEEPLLWSDLVAEHQKALSSALALRILRCPPAWSGSLDELVQNGLATAACEDPFACDPSFPAPSQRLLCDAVIPRFEPTRLWLQVHWLQYEAGQLRDQTPGQWQRLDAVPLQQLCNETCWFYPTEDGHYLASESCRDVRFAPGVLAEAVTQTDPYSYDRGELRLLWSLMADDENLSCVGLTYQRRRIEFPRLTEHPSFNATWTSFRVDGMADPSFQRLSTISTYR
ncbi:hypothetical protein FQK07_04830 [Synechococcus sp. BSF8S]|uniref:hypothetical protein n=1 Tax=Synechococcales TaxID=1890424 RepID=UPI001624AB70|nr:MULTISPECIES: hypothetical protein [unclassified Synechococcus]MBC1260599.1 hypothetical protein [Synechococcus sp. BSF8S]MBC1263249.1 hypothetical protein [Synechococcus sp. BSA11S]